MPGRVSPSANEGSERSATVDAPQLELAAVVEREPGPGEEVAHRARDEDLPRLGDREDPGGCMDGDAAHVIALDLDLTGVDAGARREPEGGGGIEHPGGSADGSAGAVEDDQEAVAGRLDLAPLVTLDVGPRRLVVVGQQGPPARVAHEP